MKTLSRSANAPSHGRDGRARRVLLAWLTAACVFAATPLAGQGSGPAQTTNCPAGVGPVFLPCQVDVPPQPPTTRPVPTYALELQRSGIGGTVHASYVIDSIGRIVPSSIVVSRALGGADFTQAVREALSGFVFTPATRQGRNVSVRYEEIFRFQGDMNGFYPSVGNRMVEHDIGPGGLPRTTVGAPSPDPAADRLYTAGDILAAQRAALQTSMAGIHADTIAGKVTLCTSLLPDFETFDHAAVPADTGTLRLLSSPHRVAVAPAQCPRTYHAQLSSILKGKVTDMDRTPAPPGWIDPYHVNVTSIRAWNRDIVLIEISVTQGATGGRERCAVRRTWSGWVSQCVWMVG